MTATNSPFSTVRDTPFEDFIGGLAHLVGFVQIF